MGEATGDMTDKAAPEVNIKAGGVPTWGCCEQTIHSVQAVKPFQPLDAVLCDAREVLRITVDGDVIGDLDAGIAAAEAGNLASTLPFLRAIKKLRAATS